MRILDVGCGIHKFQGQPGDTVVGMDRLFLQGVDVQHTMEDFPWPFKNNEFDMVTMFQSLEHVPREGGKSVGVIGEIHRILKPGGILWVEVPIGAWFYYDPTHINQVGHWYWLYFSENFEGNFYTKARFRMIDEHIINVSGIPVVKQLTKIFDRLYQLSPGATERLIGAIHIDACIRFRLRRI